MTDKFHKKDCWCEENCFWFKLENPEIITQDFQEYAEETFKQQEGEVRKF